jgi:hypothetical protein
VFIVVDDPQVLDGGVVAVRVYDSSDVIHYDDIRGQGGDSPATGPGSGVITSSTGAPALNFSSVRRSTQ